MKDLFKGDPFPSMVDLIPEGEAGDWRVEHFNISEHASAALKLRDALNRHRNSQEYTLPGQYAKLVHLLPSRSASLVHVIPVMSDTMMERKMLVEAYERAQGNVLLVGLGLGMLAQAIASKKEVNAVGIVEKSEDVITLIIPYLDNKIFVGIADTYEFIPSNLHVSCSMIYFDIWNEICGDNLKEIIALKRRYRCWLKPGGWMGAWSEKELLALR